MELLFTNNDVLSNIINAAFGGNFPRTHIRVSSVNEPCKPLKSILHEVNVPVCHESWQINVVKFVEQKLSELTFKQRSNWPKELPIVLDAIYNDCRSSSVWTHQCSSTLGVYSSSSNMYIYAIPY